MNRAQALARQLSEANLKEVTMPKQLRIAMVQGRGRFPIDMLRYDCCWPRTSADSLNIVLSITEPSNTLWQIEVAGIIDKNKRATGWTEERWISFGWEIVWRDER